MSHVIRIPFHNSAHGKYSYMLNMLIVYWNSDEQGWSQEPTVTGTTFLEGEGRWQ